MSRGFLIEVKNRYRRIDLLKGVQPGGIIADVILHRRAGPFSQTCGGRALALGS